MYLPTLDFVGRSRWPAPGSLLLLAVGVLLAAGVAFDLAAEQENLDSLNQRIDEQKRQIQRLRGAQAAVAKAGSKDDSGERRLKEGKAVVRALSMPWDGLFDALEAAQDETVALLSIVPDRASGKLLLTGEAKGYTALTAYLERLAAGGVVLQPQLLSHEVKAQYKQVAFTAQAVWAGSRP